MPRKVGTGASTIVRRAFVFAVDATNKASRDQADARLKEMYNLTAPYAGDPTGMERQLAGSSPAVLIACYLGGPSSLDATTRQLIADTIATPVAEGGYGLTCARITWFDTALTVAQMEAALIRDAGAGGCAAYTLVKRNQALPTHPALLTWTPIT